MGGTFDIQYPSENEPVFVLDFNWKLDQTCTNDAKNLFDGKRVLIFEPDDTNRGILENYCAQLNIEAYSTDGKDNLLAHILWSKKKEKPFDVIILCETLKQNTTHDLIKRIRNEAQCQTPIIYATYIQSIELSEPGLMQDIKASMIKPVSLEDLASTLNKALDDTAIDEEASRLESQQKYILVAEDSEINANIVYSHLTDMGHSVDVATDGNTALYAMHKHAYDIVFMDINMPNMDGLEATREWRKLEPEQRALPIIALTAKATSEDRQHCMDAGMNDFITKPISVKQLENVIHEYCDN